MLGDSYHVDRTYSADVVASVADDEDLGGRNGSYSLAVVWITEDDN